VQTAYGHAHSLSLVHGANLGASPCDRVQPATAAHINSEEANARIDQLIRSIKGLCSSRYPTCERLA
jgi:hypothetical protein